LKWLLYMLRYDFVNNVAGRKCDTYWSKEISVVLHWSNKYTIHIWWTCGYCVSYSRIYNLFHFHHINFSSSTSSLSSFCRLYIIGQKNHEKIFCFFLGNIMPILANKENYLKGRDTIMDNKTYIKCIM
jgi:hypothetical protein